MTVAIPTKDRPSLLRKSVTSHLRVGAPVRVYDSSGVAMSNENKTMLRHLEREYRATIRYAASREVQIYVKHLVKQGVDPDMAQYALTGGVGGVRNQMLLDNPGSQILMCDDDVIADFRVFGDYDSVQYRKASRGLKGNPEVHVNYDSLDKAVIRTSDLPAGTNSKDVLDVLGGNVAHLWNDHNAKGLVTGTKTSGRLTVLQVGCVGDPPGTMWSEFDSMRGGTSALQTREGRGWLRGPKHLVYQPTEFIRTFLLGLDNRAKLPPFLPSESTQGGLFGESMYGVLLSRALKNVYTAFLPEVVHHAPEFPKSRVARMELPGELILAEAALSVSSLGELADLLLEVEDPKGWAEDMSAKAESRIQEELSKRQGSLSTGTFTEAAPDSSVNVKVPNTKQVEAVLYFGKLIKAWPELVEASSILRGNGVSLTVTL